MEEMFNYIYSQAFSENPTDECLDAYWSLLRMYAGAIARTTNNLKGTSRFGIGALLKGLWTRDPIGTLVFITFNQDLLIEKALDTAKSLRRYSDIPWSIRHCYAIQFADFQVAANVGRRFRTAGRDSVRVLKLHGSLNWLYDVRSGLDPKNSVRSPSGTLHCLVNERILSGLTVMVRKQRRDVIPLIVPPIYEKSSRYGQAVGGIWTAAAEEIEEADRLTVFGYSFPDADFASRSLLRGSFHRNDRLQDVVVIDVSAQIAARISDVLGAQSTAHFRNVPTFLRAAS
jgi:hypothetical protein